jgi:methionyl-tRNA formyltransferase
MPDTKTNVQLHQLSVSTEPNLFPRGARPGTAIYHAPSASVLVRCADGQHALQVAALKQQDKKLIPARDFWNGVREAWYKVVDGIKVVEFGATK